MLHCRDLTKRMTLIGRTFFKATVYTLKSHLSERRKIPEMTLKNLENLNTHRDLHGEI